MEELQGEQPSRKRRVWPWILGAFIIFVVVGNLIDTDEEDRSTSTSNQTRSSSEATSEPLRQGFEYFTDDFAIRVQGGAPVSYVTSLGSGYSVKEVPDEGTYFCLVPVCIRNRSSATNTFLPLGWYLHAGGYRFEPATGADYYLDDDDQLDAHDIPPGITRCGEIVFLVTSQARWASELVLELNDWGTEALFKIERE